MKKLAEAKQTDPATRRPYFLNPNSKGRCMLKVYDRFAAN